MAAKSKGKSELLAGWYELKGPYWALPIKLTWIGQTDVAALEVAPRLNLPNIMRKAATDRLKELGADFYHDYWWLVRTVCEQFLKPIYGDPEEVIEWNPVWKIPYRVPSPENRNQTEFYHEFAKLGWVKSALAAEVLWKAFMQHCLHWLMNERKPVDMLFAELCAFPVRPNWLALVWYWDRTKKVSGTDTRKYRWARWMLDQKLNFFDPEQKVFQWSLNVRPDEAKSEPFSCTCVMHIKNRTHPLKHTEFLRECWRDTEPWKTMACRMLQHKAFMQTARYAFGLSGIYDEDEVKDIVVEVLPEPERPQITGPAKEPEPKEEAKPEPKSAPEPDPESEAPKGNDPFEGIGQMTLEQLTARYHEVMENDNVGEDQFSQWCREEKYAKPDQEWTELSEAKLRNIAKVWAQNVEEMRGITI